MSWRHLLGPFDRQPEHTGLPVTYHTPAVYAWRTAYRIDPLLALMNQPLPARHRWPSRITGETSQINAHRVGWIERGGLFLIQPDDAPDHYQQGTHA